MAIDILKDGKMKKKSLKYSRGGGNFYKYINRFLRSRVGKNWDDIYSEACEAYEVKTETGRRLRDALGWIVERKVVLKDGKPYTKQGYLLQSWNHREEFYICPETNALKMAPRREYTKYSSERENLVHRKDNEYFVCHNDIWYICEFKDWSKATETSPEVDVITKRSIVIKINWFNGQTRWDCHRLYGRGMYPITKKQCGKKELRELRKIKEKVA